MKSTMSEWWHSDAVTVSTAANPCAMQHSFSRTQKYS